MRSFVVALLLAPTLAEANQCPAFIPMLGQTEVPFGCPATVYRVQGSGDLAIDIAINPGQRSVQGAIVSAGTRTFSVGFDEPGADCQPVYSRRDVVYDAFSVELGGVQVGDTITMGPSSALIVASGPCPADAPDPDTLFCAGPYQDYQACEEQQDPPDDDDISTPTNTDDVGCSTHRASSLGLLLAFAPLLRRRRR